MLRNTRRRLRLTGLVAGAVATVVVGGYLYAPAASADIGGSLPGISGNASDPFIMKCIDHEVPGLCMYTSQDLGIDGPPGNPYPMSNTLGFFSADNGRSWTPKGTVFTEAEIERLPDGSGGFVDPGAKHLWAPGALQIGDQTTVLFLPDVANKSVPPSSGDPWGPNVHTSSRVQVVMGDSPFTPDFFPLAEVTDANGNVPGYMSDPEPFRDSDGSTHLFWADGDGDTCGGIKGANLGGWLNSVDNIQNIEITDWPSWGTCTYKDPFLKWEASHQRRTTFYHPYVEGPSIFKFSDSASDLTGLPGPYTMVVAAKPASTPSECARYGQPNKDTEVIAYATSANLKGPYKYQGLLMCGSHREWTNQATITEVTTPTGAKRMALFYHDIAPSDPTTPHNRKPHAECLWYGNGKFAMATRTTAGLTDCMKSEFDNVWALRAKQPSRPGVISAVLDDGIRPWGVLRPTSANNLFFGATIKAQANGRFVWAGSDGRRVMVADRTSVTDDKSRWNIFPTGTGEVKLVNKYSGRGAVSFVNELELVPTTSGSQPSERFDILHL